MTEMRGDDRKARYEVAHYSQIQNRVMNRDERHEDDEGFLKDWRSRLNVHLDTVRH
jgi:hypothetical protein